MNEPTVSIIEPKLAELLRFVHELEQCTSAPYEQFILDFRNTRTAERDLELTVELASDIVNHLLIHKQLPPPQSYRDAFVRAAQAGIIESSSQISSHSFPRFVIVLCVRMTGLRRRLQRYEHLQNNFSSKNRIANYYD